MKYSITIILTNLILLFSCKDTYMDCEGHQFIESTHNNSDYPIKIKIWSPTYNPTSPIETHSFTLLQNNVLYSKHGVGAWTIDLSDSLQVIFDNKKKIVFSREEIRGFESPSIRNEQYCETINSYIFTNNHYETAEDCNGECE